jgi:hypothetical protein
METDSRRSLVGVVESYDTYVGKYGESKVCIIRDQAEGSLIPGYLSSTVLFKAFKKLRLKIGGAPGYSIPREKFGW